ncbi:DUF596 domain-containing protein [Jeongeupia naejangsanensis]|uniref:DUF596 domain-containing protein n=1 Tax=Jeongeupia naejangsanensis TaxID=613195 RepID=A0ABS2BIS4_9NEIS|nr:DUF596 domain-containing protein [Jeongeupia naejangsanensis]MBM3114876.1 DUF596 domain-containing protein [Jeongeupia naejangsanensis]
MNDLALSNKDMKLMDKEIPELINGAFGMSMGAVWCLVDGESYEWRKHAFLYVVGRLLETGAVKLGRKGVLLEGGVEELLASIENSWPPADEFDDDQFCTVVPYEVEGVEGLCTQYWTPGDLVWVNEFGQQVWSTDAEN